MSSYLPTRESELNNFASSFAGHITASPMTYALIAGDAAQIQAAADRYAEKFALANDPATRTEGAVVQKNEAKETLIAILRAYARQIKGNQAVSNQAKTDLGIGTYDLVRSSPVPTPTTRPRVNIARVDVKQHQLRFVDSENPEKRGKPQGVHGLQLFWHIGDAAAGVPADPLASRFVNVITNTALTINFKPEDSGKTAYYFARWQNGTGKTGPWSVMVSMPIAG